MQEIWRDITNFKGLYQVSSFGRVKSLKRPWVNEDFIIKICNDESGYSIVCLSKNGKQNTKYVHRIMAFEFLNHTPCGHLIVIDHINNIKSDNRIENLQLISNRENCTKNMTRGKNKYTGVYQNKNKWSSKIYINGKQKHLGSFYSQAQASEAYQFELRKLKK